jgi:DNA-binding transcriptional ArsR family regulator
MNVLLEPDFPGILSSGRDLDGKEKLFRILADRTRRRILDALCQGAKTVGQVAAVTRLSEANVSTELDYLIDSGCVRRESMRHPTLYALNVPGWIGLAAVALANELSSSSAGR